MICKLTNYYTLGTGWDIDMKSKRRNLLNYKSRGSGKTKHKHLSKRKRSKRKHRNKKLQPDGILKEDIQINKDIQ